MRQILDALKDRTAGETIQERTTKRKEDKIEHTNDALVLGFPWGSDFGKIQRVKV